MSLDTLIRKALDSGIELSYADGKLQVTGRRQAVALFAPQLRVYKDQLIEAYKPKPVDWKPLARSYHTHHFNCPICIAAGQGVGKRCGTGLTLWTIYQNATQ